MSVTSFSNSNVSRAVSTRRECPTTVVKQVVVRVVTVCVPAPAPGSASAVCVASRRADGFEQAPGRRGEWAKFRAEAGALAAQPHRETPSTRAVRQTTDNNCGAAAVATVASGKRAPVAASDAQVVDELTNRFSGGDGTTPQELSRMLASKGLGVKEGKAQFDDQVVNDALKKGDKVVALVDSNRIVSTTGAKDPGRAHWVVVDGLDEAAGRYNVKDPGTGSSYSVGREDLQHAVADGWGMHQGGGVVVTEEARSGTSEEALAEENTRKAEALGKSSGGGSRAMGSFGRESS